MTGARLAASAARLDQDRPFRLAVRSPEAPPIEEIRDARLVLVLDTYAKEAIGDAFFHARKMLLVEEPVALRGT